MTTKQTSSLSPGQRAGITHAWVQVFRLFSYTATIVPVGLGAALAAHCSGPVRWWLFPLILVAAILIQAGTNLVGEYYDFKKGVDRPETYGSSRVLVDGLLDPMEVLLVGLACFALSAMIGLIFVMLHGWQILLIGIIGILGGLFYTATPVAYKYVGLGDICVFCLMGPLMVIGSFYVLTGSYHHSVLLISLPVGFLVAGILSGNNLRDITHDTQAHIKTTATFLGHRWARWEYSGLTIAAYLATLAMVAFRILPIWSLLVLLTVPLAVKNLRVALKSKPEDPSPIIMLDVQTAQLHLAFGVLLIVSVMIGGAL